MTLPTAWRYTLADPVDAALDRQHARADWWAAWDAFTLPPGAERMAPAALLAALVPLDAAERAAWVAWTGDTAAPAPLSDSDLLCAEAS